MDDATLIRRICEGDSSAIRIMMENNKNLIWHIIVSMTGKNSDSEDLFQEIIFQVYKGIRRFRSDSRLSTWIGSIAHHVCVDHLRRKNKKDIMLVDIEDTISLKNLSDKGWKESDKNDLHRLILEAVALLPPAYRTAVTLYHLDECSYREIADITGMPDGTVKSYISRGRNMLREILLKLIPDITEVLADL